MKESHRRHLKGTLYTALYFIPINLRGLILIPILTRNLDIAIYGAVATFQTVIPMFVGVSCLGLQDALSRFLPAAAAEKKRDLFFSILSAAVGTNAVLFALAWAAAPWVGPKLGVSAVCILLAAAIVFVETLAGIGLEFFRATERSVTFLVILGVKFYAEIGALAWGAIHGGRLEEILRALLAVDGVFFLAIFAGVLPLAGGGRAFRFELRPYLRYSLPLLPTILSDWVINLSDRVLISVILGNAAVGFYSPAYALGSIILSVATIFLTLMPPLVARLHDSGQRSDLDDVVQYTLRYYLVAGIPVFFGGLWLSRPLIAWLSNDSIANQSWPVAPVVVLGCLFLGCARILSQILSLNLKTTRMAEAWLLAAVINVGLNLLLLRKLGILAAALSTTLAFFAALWAIKRASDRFHPISFRRLGIEKMVFASLLMSAVVGLLLQTPVHVLGILVAGIAVYFGSLLAIGAFSDREKRLFQFLIDRFRPVGSSR